MTDQRNDIPPAGTPCMVLTWQSLRIKVNNVFTCGGVMSSQAMELMLQWRGQEKWRLFKHPVTCWMPFTGINSFIMYFLLLHPYALGSAVHDIVRITKKNNHVHDMISLPLGPKACLSLI